MVDPTRFQQLLRFFADFFRRNTGSASLALLLMTMIGLLNGISLLLLLPLLASTGLLQGHHEQAIPLLGSLFQGFEPNIRFTLVLAIYIAVVGSFAMLKYCAARLNAQLVMGFIDQARSELYQRILASPWHVISRRHSHEITNQLSSNLDWILRGAHGVCQFISILLVAAFQLVVACLLSFKLVLLALVVIILGYPLMRWLQRRALDSGQSAVNHNQRLHETSGSLVSRFKQIKAHGHETRELQGLSASSRSLADTMIDLQVSAARMQLIFELLAVALIAGLFYLGFTWLDVPIASLLVFLFVMAQFMPRLINMQRMLHTLTQALPAHQSYLHFMAELQPAPPAEETVPTASGEVTRITYRPHDTTQAPVHFGGLVLECRVGEITALVGESGIGKTSLCDILAGLHPEHCDVLLNGQPHDNGWAWLRQSMAYVPQAAHPWQKTVREALLWGYPKADDRMLWETLEQVGLKQRIASQAKGLDAALGDSGIGLSGGELQRLMLAQALIRQPRLLILDEITSALDSETEDHIIRALTAAKENTAIVVATHRSALRDCADRCYELQKHHQQRILVDTPSNLRAPS